MNKANIYTLLEGLTGQEGQRAFRALYEHYFIRLFRFSHGITRSREVAEEVANDCLMMVWSKRGMLSGVKNPEVYLYVAVKNESLARLRKENMRHTIDIGESFGEELRVAADPEKLMITAEMTRQLTESINNLPPRCRAIFQLVKEDGMKYKDVANLLNLSVKTVEAQLTIAVKKIAEATQLDTRSKRLRFLK